jgi:hypothetical protein
MLRRAACRGAFALPAQFAGPQIFRSQVLLALLLLTLMTSAYAHACDAGYKDYYGRCVEACGIDEFKLTGPKTTLRGYVPRTNPQGAPSLWTFRNMSGLC